MRRLVPLLVLLGACRPESNPGQEATIEVYIRGLKDAFAKGSEQISILEFELRSDTSPVCWNAKPVFPNWTPDGGTTSLESLDHSGADAPELTPGKSMRLHLTGYVLEGPYSFGRSRRFDLADKETKSVSVVMGLPDTFSPVRKDPLTKRVLHTATELSDGTVLLVGGRYEESDLVKPAMGELLNLATGTACNTCLTGVPSPEIELHTATALKDGKVLIAGGRFIADGAESDFIYLVEPGAEAGQWNFSLLAPKIRPRAGHSAIYDETNDRVILAGGYRGGVAVVDSDVILHPSSNVEVSVGPSLTQPRAQAATVDLVDSTTDGSGALLVGGVGADGFAMDTAEVWMRDNTFVPPVDDAPGRQKMRTARKDLAAVLMMDGRVLVLGGTDAAGNKLKTAEVFSFEFSPPGAFVDVASDLLHAVAGHTATRLENGDVLVVGGDPGQKWGELFQPKPSPDLFGTPYQGDFRGVTTLPAIRSGHCATALSDGSILFSGGTTDGSLVTDAADNQSIAADAELYVPMELTKMPPPACTLKSR